MLLLPGATTGQYQRYCCLEQQLGCINAIATPLTCFLGVSLVTLMVSDCVAPFVLSCTPLLSPPSLSHRPPISPSMVGGASPSARPHPPDRRKIACPAAAVLPPSTFAAAACSMRETVGKACVYVWVYVWGCVCVCVYVCVWMFVCVCMYMHSTTIPNAPPSLLLSAIRT